MFVLTDWLIDDWLGIKFAKDIKKYYDDRLWSSWICFYLDAKHFIHETNPIDQAKAQKVWSGEREMKSLLRVALQREIKQGMVAKWPDFLLLYHLTKGFAIASITRNLIVKYLWVYEKQIY